ncbi:MAG: M1 family aminopeptidase [Planctomycetota bacterium]
MIKLRFSGKGPSSLRAPSTWVSARRLGAALALLGACGAACHGPSSEALPVEPVLRPAFALLPADDLAVATDDRGAATRPAREADLVHLSLDLTFDWERRAVHGSATSWLRALRPGTDEVRLAASGIEVREVLDAAGRSLAWRLEGDQLVVSLAAPLALDVEEPVQVVYAVRPTAGLYFGAAPGGAAFGPEIHARGLPRGNRHWFPTLDAPGDRTTLDARFRVGFGMSVVGSGELVETREHGDGERTFVWRLSEPVPVATIGFAAARMRATVQGAVGATTVRTHVPEQLSAAAVAATFRDAVAALEFFGVGLARPYPYARYDQVVVHDLGVRGLESATASLFDAEQLLLTDDERLDAADAPRRTVTHELAHHWFGIFVAPLDERERWLAEAFAAWLELEFEAHLLGPDAVAVLYEEMREELLDSGAAGTIHAERVPAHYYTKGPWVLRMIEGLVGNEGLWTIARALVRQHGGGFFATEDLRRVALQETGYELGPMLERWVDGAGVPRLQIEVADLARGGARIVVTQRGAAPGALQLPVEFVLADGARVVRNLALAERQREFVEWFGSDVLDVVIDPDGRLCAGFDIRKPVTAWLRQAAPTSGAAARWRVIAPLAAAAGGRDAGAAEALQGLLSIALQDPLAGIRRRALERLSTYDPRAAAPILRVLEGDPDARVRRAAVRALHQLYARGAFDLDALTLERLILRRQAEPSPSVREALDTLLQLAH